MIQLKLGLTRETAEMLRDYIGTTDAYGGRYTELFNHLNAQLDADPECCDGTATDDPDCCGGC